MSFEVKIDVFEGPFELLFQLIMRQELNIHEVPVAQITTSYLEYLESVPELDLDSATEFLVIAATLLLIKARSLLPRPQELEAAEDSQSAKQYLIERLIEYKKFSNVAEWLEGVYAREGWYMPRLRELEGDYSELYPDPFEGLSVSGLPGALMELLIENAGDYVDVTFIAPIRVSVAEYIEKVRGCLAVEGETTFSKLTADCRSKIKVIAAFLAILELCKKGEVALTQRRSFGEIKIKSEGRESSVA